MTAARLAGRTSPAVDRAAAVRAALVRLVARQGFHGTSMSAIAHEAGVGTGTAYVHYASKDELVLAAYAEAKRDLGRAAVARIDPAADAATRFRQLWGGVHDHLQAQPDRARFLLQVDTSPYADDAHQRALESESDRLLAEAGAPDMAGLLAPLPPLVLYDLALGPVVRLVASGLVLDADGIDALRDACWRAVTAP